MIRLILGKQPKDKQLVKSIEKLAYTGKMLQANKNIVGTSETTRAVEVDIVDRTKIIKLLTSVEFRTSEKVNEIANKAVEQSKKWTNAPIQFGDDPKNGSVSKNAGAFDGIKKVLSPIADSLSGIIGKSYEILSGLCDKLFAPFTKATDDMQNYNSECAQIESLLLEGIECLKTIDEILNENENLEIN